MRHTMRHTLARSIVLAALLGAVVAAAAAFAENVDPGNGAIGEQYAWGENVGWINAEPAVRNGQGTPTPLDEGVTVSGQGVTGYMYGENIGWINLSCKNNDGPPPGDICNDTDNYGITNDGLGNLGGYAWGENVGWISFSCTNAVPQPAKCTSTENYGVHIDPLTGSWSGHAYGENIGWIKFDHSQPDNRIKTVDQDAIAQATDNCKFDANAAQTNSDAANGGATLLGFPGADVFGDVCDGDDDGDGCTDAQESGSTNPQFGGNRNPLFVWDFYDVNGDRAIDLQDTLVILNHFGHNSNDAVDNFLDRQQGAAAYAPEEATGNQVGVDLLDALLSLQSFGHSCAP